MDTVRRCKPCPVRKLHYLAVLASQCLEAMLAAEHPTADVAVLAAADEHCVAVEKQLHTPQMSESRLGRALCQAQSKALFFSQFWTAVEKA